MRVFTDLNLHQNVPARAQPGIGEWGPMQVPSVKQKRRGRLWWPIVMIAVAAALATVGYFVWKMIVNAVGL